jgi:hypothetical protein
MPKKLDWPAELKKPFAPHRIADEAVKGLVSTEGAAERISRAFMSEVERRVEIMAGFVDVFDEGPSLPRSKNDWLRFVLYLCKYWHIPAFEEAAPKKRGAKQKWTDEKRQDLFYDVTSLVRKGMTESAACIHIAKNPRKFHQKYPTNSRTVHREFLRAKRLDFIPF